MHLRWIGLTLVVLLAAMLIAGVIGIGAVQRRAIAAPSINLTMGAYHLRAFATHTPNCRIPGNQPGNSFCSSNSIYSTDEYYVVWLLNRSRRGNVTFEEARRLAVFRLNPPNP
ncbi:MAG: hypothetical protein NZM94_11225 [Roseiflexus sp.]|nr:hypothetical protein [Roseiflexus sp.]